MAVMSTAIDSRTRLEAGVSVFAASLIAWFAALLIGGTVVSGSNSHSVAADRGSPAAAVSAGAHGTFRIALVVGDGVATATLADTPAAREFATTLPLTIDTEDRFGQAAIGQLPHGLRAGDDDPVVDPAPGGLYYWAQDRTIAVLTTDLGASVPAPGLVRLGAVDAGLDVLASAGNHFRMTIRPAV